MFDIDRKTAARLLKVSIRTVDRYLVKGKLNSESRDGRIWLDKKEILRLRQTKRVDNTDMLSTPGVSIDNVDVIPVDMSTDNGQTVYTRKPENEEPPMEKSQEEVYKKLFEELQTELKQKQERLEGANYRVGQLESLLKESVPLLDYKRDLNVEKAQKEQIQKALSEREVEAESLQSTLKEERFNKKVYLIILFILLALQPLWFIFPLK